MMKQYANTIERKLLSAFFRAKQMACRTKEALENNQGDTHFVAILVAIVIVVVLAVVFQTEMTTLFDGAFDKVNTLVDGLFS